MALKINNKFKIFQFVYVASDNEQKRHQVVQINILPGDELVYTLACDGSETLHYESEITDKKDVLLGATDDE
jgi:hypothetical protein